MFLLYKVVFSGFAFDRPVNEVLTTLEPIFEMDMYLPRSIVACLNVVELVKILKVPSVPIEVACATVLHWIKSTKTNSAEKKVCCLHQNIKSIFFARDAHIKGNEQMCLIYEFDYVVLASC